MVVPQKHSFLQAAASGADTEAESGGSLSCQSASILRQHHLTSIGEEGLFGIFLDLFCYKIN